MTGDPPVIHDLESAARRARVTEDVILRWVREGLRATPTGSVGRRGPRNYVIFDCWLTAFLESRSRQAAPPSPPAGPAAAPPRRGRPAAGGDLVMPRPKGKP